MFGSTSILELDRYLSWSLAGSVLFSDRRFPFERMFHCSFPGCNDCFHSRIDLRLLSGTFRCWSVPLTLCFLLLDQNPTGAEYSCSIYEWSTTLPFMFITKVLDHHARPSHTLVDRFRSLPKLGFVAIRNRWVLDQEGQIRMVQPRGWLFRLYGRCRYGADVLDLHIHFVRLLCSIHERFWSATSRLVREECDKGRRKTGK